MSGENFSDSPVDVSYIDGASIISVSVIFGLLSLVMVGLRFHVRRVQKASLSWDDWLLVPALLLILGMAIAMVIGAAGHGLGYGKGLPPGAPMTAQFTFLSPEIVLTESVQFAVQLMQILAIGLIKLSFVMFYRRIFCTSQRSWFSIVTIVVLVLVLAWMIAFFFVFIFYCGTNTWAEWSTVVNIITYCPNTIDDQLALAISDTITDLIIVVLPIPMILQLQLTTAKKLLVIGVFLMGSLAVTASIVRMGIFIKLCLIGFDPKLDGDKDVGILLFWSMFEGGAAITAVCLPSLHALQGRVLVNSFFRSIGSNRLLRSSQASDTEAGFTLASSQHDSSADQLYYYQSYAMHDISEAKTKTANVGVIAVESKVEQTREMA